MPAFGKKSLSLFLRNNCERQFLLSLYTDTERKQHGMPPRQQQRAALGLVGQAGYDWQAEKVKELETIFGKNRVHLNPTGSAKRPGTVDLLTILPQVSAYDFIVEAAFDPETPAFRNAVGISTLHDYYGSPISLSHTHPDIVQVLPPVCEGLGPEVNEKINPYERKVLPDGETTPLGADDNRLRLRVIDVKLTAEPGAHYFAEVVYYSMALAAWLEHHNLADRFVVASAPAVWPGSHEASNLSRQLSEWNRQAYQPTATDMTEALVEDIELAPLEVFAPRLRRFFQEQLPIMISAPWEELAWHLDYRCKGCEFIGYPWKDQNGQILNDSSQCWPSASRNAHLSRIFGLSRGASEVLRDKRVSDVPSLASTPAHSPVFDDHQGLRAKRSTFPERAKALQSDTTTVIPYSGSDAMMPRWPNLHIYLFLDYDLSSAITASIGVRAFWSEPLDIGSTLNRRSIQWNSRQGHDEVFLVDKRDLVRERAEFLKFLRHLRDIFNTVVREDLDSQQNSRHNKTSTFQVYLWDESQRKHLVRLIGRHLPYILTDASIRSLAWLFPPPELLEQVEEDTRQSPLTLVANVIANTIAVPIPHHYTLLDVVQTYKPQSVQNAPSVHPLYQEPMSDLIPAERIHEWWERIGRWDEKQDLIKETAGKKVYALNLLVSQLEHDLKGILARHAAPPVIRPSRTPAGVAPQGHLWREFGRLNAALTHLEVSSIRAMPPHEREARLKSARLKRRLQGKDELEALDRLSRVSGNRLNPDPNLFVYEMRPGSYDVNFKPGEFLCALAPETEPGFLDRHPYPLRKGTSLEKQWIYGNSIAESGMTQVSIEAIDRTNGLIALRGGRNNCIVQLERETSLSFQRNVVLDPTHSDFLTSKIDLTVRGIGHPASATANSRIVEALGLSSSTLPGTGMSSPAAEALWEAPTLRLQQSSRNRQTVRKQLDAHFSSAGRTTLNKSQWDAWEDALSRRLSLIWGPPGTGKSRTLRAIVQGALLDAQEKNQPLRILITANTYNAVDNVLLKVEQELRGLLRSGAVKIYRIQSKWRSEAPPDHRQYPTLANLIMNASRPNQDVQDLRDELERPTQISVIGSTPSQLHNLSVAGFRPRRPSHTMREWFDFIIVDEASQMDVGASTLIFSKLAGGGSVVLAGDDLQLPPIHQAESPQDLEHVVGSVYNYFRHHHSIEPNSLDVNYRSSQTLVEFTKLAGYSDELSSYSPDLKLNLLSPIPQNQPVEWPSDLCWSACWAKFLDLEYPAVSYIYEDVLSSQTNDFEADSIAALLWLLHGRMGDQLLNERAPDGAVHPASENAYDPVAFWDRAVGVVAPHRAQVAKIINRLHNIFPSQPAEAIRSAVDTVERFQGQQRDVIIASFGLGDPDIINAEDEFLFNLNRFNVLTSRARAKVIVFATRSVLQHLSDDVNVLRESRLLKLFIESYCINPEILQLGFNSGDGTQYRVGELRRR